MASSIDEEPPLSSAPSFTIRTTQHQQQHQAGGYYINNHNFTRSISNKEPTTLSESPNIPPRLSLTSPLSSQYLISQPSTPPGKGLSFSTPSKDHQDHNNITPICRCISSVLKKDGQILCIAVSNGLVYTGCQSNVIRIWKLPEFMECGQLKTKACMVVAIHVSNEKVYAAYADTKIRVWHRTWEGAIKHVRVLTIPRAGSYVRTYITGRDKTMKHSGPVTAIAINISDDILYSASVDKTVKVWLISELKCIETILAHNEPINSIAVADDGVLYTASDDATVKVWRRNFCTGDRRPHSLTITLPAKHSPVKTLTLTSDGGVLYGGCSDGYIHYWLKGWFLGQLQYGGALQGHTHAVMCLANVCNYMVSGSADSTCRVWVRDLVDGLQHICLAVLKGHRGPIRSVAAFIGRNGTEEIYQDEDECSVCSGSLDGAVKMWRIKSKNNSSAQGSSASNSCEYFEL